MSEKITRETHPNLCKLVDTINRSPNRDKIMEMFRAAADIKEQNPDLQLREALVAGLVATMLKYPRGGETA